MGAIYRIFNTDTGQSYIGQSDRPYHRINNHLTPGCPNGSTLVQAALLNHPPESWQWEMVADNKDYPLVSLNALECLFIDLYDARTHGYNINPGGGAPPCGDTQDETQFRKGMRDRIVRAISNYQREVGPVINWDFFNALAKAEVPDANLIQLIENRAFGPDIQNLEHLKDLMDQAQASKQLKKARQQMLDSASAKSDEILKILKPTLDAIPENQRPYYFFRFSINFEKNDDDPQTNGAWAVTQRILTPFDYEII